MRIQYAGLITKNDFLQCLLLHYSHFKLRKWIFGLFGIFLIFGVISMGIRRPTEFAGMFSAMLPGVLAFSVFLSYPWWLPYLQLTGYAQKGNIYQGNVHGIIDNVEISVNGAYVKASFRWNAYIDYKVSKDILLLYLGKNNFSIFMKSMFSDQNEWETFVAFAKDKVSLNKKHA